MSAGYYLDFQQFSLDLLKERIQHSLLIPSHQLLLTGLDENFDRLASAGVSSLEELYSRCANKKKLLALAAETGIPEKYIEVLNRHAGIYRPQPNVLAEIPGLDAGSLERLSSAGCKNTRQLWEAALTPEMRDNLAIRVNVSADFLLEAACLSDLTRAGYVGPIFARLLYEAGARSIRLLADFDPQELFERTLTVNREKQYTRGSYQAKDLAWCVDIAHLLPVMLEE